MVEFRSVVEAIALVATKLGICGHHEQGKPTRSYCALMLINARGV
jgi:hypothetical protein